MHRATLPEAKSTISRRMLSESPDNERRSIARCYTDRQLSVISTYVHSEAQTPLSRFVVDIYCTTSSQQIHSKSKGWSLSLSVSLASTAVGANINRGPLSTALLTSLNSVPWRHFSKFTAAHAKEGLVTPPTLLLGVICYLFGKTI